MSVARRHYDRQNANAGAGDNVALDPVDVLITSEPEGVATAARGRLDDLVGVPMV